MSTPTYTLDFSTQPVPTRVGSRSVRRAWGALCGATFFATRASIYLLVLPFAALVSLTGVVVYAAQALIGPPRG
jgi:hypothetical protein